MRLKAGIRRLSVAITAATLLISLSACEGHPTSAGPAASPVSGRDSRDVDAATAERLDAAISEAMTAAAVPGAIIGIWGPDGQYVRAVGVADKATGAPMHTDFYSRIGSETKTFTVTALLQLADQGKLGLDDPIAKYVEGVPQGAVITLRELARMQSGLANYTAAPEFLQIFINHPDHQFTRAELLDYAFAQPLAFTPGTQYKYTNTNTLLLGLVVEKVSGQPLADFVNERILAPLGMKHTLLPDSEAFPDPHAQGYTDLTPDGAAAVAPNRDPSWGWAVGTMLSTLEDMHTWAPALATGRLLSAPLQAQRLQTVGSPDLPADGGYGLGLFNIAGWIGHNGTLPGYQSVVVYLPDRQTTLVILINTDIGLRGEEPSTTLATAITKIISPDHVYTLTPQRPPATQSAKPR